MFLPPYKQSFFLSIKDNILTEMIYTNERLILWRSVEFWSITHNQHLLQKVLQNLEMFCLFSGPWFTGSVKRLSLLFFRFLTILPWLNTADVVTLELLKVILKCSLKIDVVLYYLSFKSWNWCSKVAQCVIFDSIKNLC